MCFENGIPPTRRPLPLIKREPVTQVRPLINTMDLLKANAVILSVGRREDGAVFDLFVHAAIESGWQV